MEAALRLAIRHARDDEGKHGGEEVRRSSQEKSDSLAETEGLDDSREELSHGTSSGL